MSTTSTTTLCPDLNKCFDTVKLSCIKYQGIDLNCLNIMNQDRLNEFLQVIEARVCEIRPTTTTTTTLAPCVSPTDITVVKTVAPCPSPVFAYVDRAYAPTTTTTSTSTTTTTTLCRPTGLTQVKFIKSWIYNGGSYNFSTTNPSFACTVWQGLLTSTSSGAVGVNEAAYQSLAIGQSVFKNYGTDCTKMENGVYWLYPGTGTDYLNYFTSQQSIVIITVNNGVITAIDDCERPATTTTTSSTTTTTTTVLDCDFNGTALFDRVQFDCNFSGQAFFDRLGPATVTVIAGSNLTVNSITGVDNFSLPNPITNTTFTGFHLFGNDSGTVTINVTNVSAGDYVSLYRNEDISANYIVLEQALLEGDNNLIISYSSTDTLTFIFGNNL